MWVVVAEDAQNTRNARFIADTLAISEAYFTPNVLTNFHNAQVWLFEDTQAVVQTHFEFRKRVGRYCRWTSNSTVHIAGSDGSPVCRISWRCVIGGLSTDVVAARWGTSTFSFRSSRFLESRSKCSGFRFMGIREKRGIPYSSSEILKNCVTKTQWLPIFWAFRYSRKVYFN